MGLKERLYPTREGHREIFIEMSGRWAELESDLCSNGPARLRRELFPEVAGEDVARAPGSPPNDIVDEEMQALNFLSRALRIMEDVWVAADLDTYPSQPLAEGWINYFQRWASTPTLRRWWPILRPLYSNGFRDFARDQFGVGVVDPKARPKSDRSAAGSRLVLTVERNHARFKQGHAWRQFVQRSTPPPLRGLTVLAYRVVLADIDGLPGGPLDVGFVLTDQDRDSGTATIRGHHFYVPPALVGAGIIARLLDAVIEHYKGQGFGELKVDFGGPGAKPVRGQAARDARIREIEFFKSRGFEQLRPGLGTLDDVAFSLRLDRPDSPGEA
jgi:GNAT superfamily N-acetyltransferase